MKNAEMKVNIGIQILRLICCFWVVSDHCYRSKNNKIAHFFLTTKKLFHVPVFMFLSFYFYYKHLKDQSIKKIKVRFNRLLIPYLIWPLIFLISNNICHKIFGFGNFKRILSLWDYFSQIIHSGQYYPPFWFTTVVSLFSLFFTIFALLFSKHFLFIIQIFASFIYNLHRSSNIYTYLKRKNLYKLSFVLSIRMLPIAAVGLTFGSLNKISKLKIFYWQIMIMNGIFLYFLFKFDIFQFQKEFLYYDLDSNIFAAINFFFFFFLIPLENINKNIAIIIKVITKYTGGIYYLHSFIKRYFNHLFKSVRYGTFNGLIIIYIVSYLICHFGYKIFCKTQLKYLFI